jgi:hypothetical protein
VIDIKVSLAFGAALMIAGGALFRWHFAAWDGYRRDATLADRERNFYRTQFRRRVQVAGLIVLMGILVPLLDFVISKRLPNMFTALTFGILLVTGWIMILAALDWLSMRVFNRSVRSSLESLAQKRRELEEEVERLRKRGSGGEGDAPAEPPMRE